VPVGGERQGDVGMLGFGKQESGRDTGCHIHIKDNY
jgi:hypothetical protein